MKKLTDLDNFKMNEKNDLFSNDDMADIEKITLYCDELIGADLLPPSKKFETKLEAFKKATIELKIILDDLNNSNLLPHDTNGSMPEPVEILSLLPKIN